MDTLSSHPAVIPANVMESTFLRKEWKALSRVSDGQIKTIIDLPKLKINIRVEHPSGRWVMEFLFPADGLNPKFTDKLKFITYEIKTDASSELTRCFTIAFDMIQAGDCCELWPHFAESLTQNIFHASEKTSALKAIKLTFEKWAKIWPGRRGLGPKVLQGLFAELIFLQKLAELTNFPLAVEAWHGPAASDHDFAVNGHAFEVKSTLKSSYKVEISNYAQLISKGKTSLHLVHIALRKSEDFPKDSLEKLGNDLLVQAGEYTQTALTLRAKMINAGWFRATDEQKREVGFRKIDLTGYKIINEFPRILTINIKDISPALIVDHYKVDLEQCGDFRISEDTFDLLLSDLEQQKEFSIKYE